MDLTGPLQCLKRGSKRCLKGGMPCLATSAAACWQLPSKTCTAASSSWPYLMPPTYLDDRIMLTVILLSSSTCGAGQYSMFSL